jgi:hypothetical protein
MGFVFTECFISTIFLIKLHDSKGINQVAVIIIRMVVGDFWGRGEL